MYRGWCTSDRRSGRRRHARADASNPVTRLRVAVRALRVGGRASTIGFGVILTAALIAFRRPSSCYEGVAASDLLGAGMAATVSGYLICSLAFWSLELSGRTIREPSPVGAAVAVGGFVLFGSRERRSRSGGRGSSTLGGGTQPKSSWRKDFRRRSIYMPIALSAAHGRGRSVAVQAARPALNGSVATATNHGKDLWTSTLRNDRPSKADNLRGVNAWTCSGSFPIRATFLPLARFPNRNQGSQGTETMHRLAVTRANSATACSGRTRCSKTSMQVTPVCARRRWEACRASATIGVRFARRFRAWTNLSWR